MIQTQSEFNSLGSWVMLKCLKFKIQLTIFKIRINKRMKLLLPTKIIGTFGQKCLTSTDHFSTTFSSVSGKLILYVIRTTSKKIILIIERILLLTN